MQRELVRGRVSDSHRVLQGLDLGENQVVRLAKKKRNLDSFSSFIRTVFWKGLSVFENWYLFSRYRFLIKSKYTEDERGISLILVMSKEERIPFEMSNYFLKDVDFASFVSYIQMLREYYLRHKLTIFNYKQKMRALFCSYWKQDVCFFSKKQSFRKVFQRKEKLRVQKKKEESLRKRVVRESEIVKMSQYSVAVKKKNQDDDIAYGIKVLSFLKGKKVRYENASFLCDQVLIRLPFLFLEVFFLILYLIVLKS